MATLFLRRIERVERFAIEGDCGYGWSIECHCDDEKDAEERLKDYHENVSYPVRIKRWTDD